ncbi:hypothetical protein Misp06_02745 [Microbulbifer sp. NBRC 101763]|uniref:hypothetical protein n=1 Tax=unclassified Microbulbifer TaxID=2619833 RepID=UPI0024AD67F7|nr:hypothetical protein [Microbulbifer sp. MLAF003]WHI53258.1 hypothetical protein P3339_11040 [Microbulbifer sp. MLAF003]
MIFVIVLVLNTIWFLMGFNVFSLRGKIFAKLVVPREHRDTPVFGILAESGKFLGGFNFSLAFLNILLLINLSTFSGDIQRAVLLLAFAVTHGSQFIYNVPVALQNRSGGGAWQVKGVMRFIFIVDFLMMLLNLFVAIWYYL